MFMSKMRVAGLLRSHSWSLLSVIFIVFLERKVSGNVNNPAGLVHRRFEYKYSFKPPYLAQKDGSVPFWEYGGNAIASSESVRVAPSLRSQKGAIWTKSQTNFTWWDIEIVFRVTGRGRIGADGLAFWYTTEKGDYNGPVFGSSDRWNGLGIFFDSFDNDNKHNNPYIMAVVNDGTKQFDHQNDGTTQLLSGCLRDFRNKQFPTRARIEYYNNVLTVLFHNGLTNNNDDYEFCIRADNVELPPHGYFGLSAATGGLADDHDVYHFLTSSLHPPGLLPETAKIPDGTEKLTQEYQEYQLKLEKTKQEYKEKHPEEVHKRDDEWDDFYESDNQRELRQIYQGQSQMSESLRDISRKIDEVIGKQENTLAMVSRGMNNVAGQIPVPAPGVPQLPGTITKPDIDMMLTNQNILLNTIREIRSIVGEIHMRADTIIGNQARAPTAQIQTTGYDVQSIIAEMRDGMNQVKQGVSHLGQRMDSPQAGFQTTCPTATCVGVTLFLSVSVVQLVLVFIYSLFKNRSESQMKKFY